MAEVSLGKIDRLRPFLLISSIVAGLAFGTLVPGYGSFFNAIVYFSLIFLIFSLVLGIPFKDFTRSLTNIRFFAVAWFLNFVVIPLVGFLLALVFLGPYPAIFVGFLLYMIAPCTDWFLMFTSLARGDVPLGLALLPTNLVLQIALIPVYLYLFAGETVPFQLASLVETLIVFILIPFVLAWMTRWIFSKARSEEWREKVVGGALPVVQLITLMLIIFSMFAGQSQVIYENLGPLSVVVIPVVLFFIISFALAQAASMFFRLNYGECALLTCTTAARNSPLSLAIAVGLFPDQPLIQVAIIIPVLIELPLLILVVRGLLTIRQRRSLTVEE